jgi:hypothetical protein
MEEARQKPDRINNIKWVSKNNFKNLRMNTSNMTA